MTITSNTPAPWSSHVALNVTVPCVSRVVGEEGGVGTFTTPLVSFAGTPIKLSRKEYDLLRILASHPGKVITHQQLLQEVWGPAYVEETQYLRVYVGKLRQKLERDPASPKHLITEPGVGYRLQVG